MLMFAGGVKAKGPVITGCAGPSATGYPQGQMRAHGARGRRGKRSECRFDRERESTPAKAMRRPGKTQHAPQLGVLDLPPAFVGVDPTRGCVAGAATRPSIACPVASL